MNKEKRLTASKEIEIRFSEVDSMGIVWHGSYAKYFEDVREAFGTKYGLGYLTMFSQGVYAPLVKLDFNYKKSMVYGQKMTVEAEYIPTQAAKICFNYKVYSVVGSKKTLMATGSSVQVFLDKQYQLMWTAPEFYLKWKECWNV